MRGRVAPSYVTLDGGARGGIRCRCGGISDFI